VFYEEKKYEQEMTLTSKLHQRCRMWMLLSPFLDHDADAAMGSVKRLRGRSIARCCCDICVLGRAGYLKDGNSGPTAQLSLCQ